MRFAYHIHNAVVAAFICFYPFTAIADNGRANDLLDRLANPDLRNWEVIEQEIQLLWSRSGSASADYLLQRGLEALDIGNMEAAYNYLTALTDHAPDFAEGWHARAMMFFRMNRYGLSIADIQRTLALEPRHFEAFTGLGIMLEDMGLLDTALNVFRVVRAIHPHRQDIIDAITRIEQARDGQSL